MTTAYAKKKMVWLALGVLLSGLLLGCGDKKTLKKDPFFEKWKVMAEESRAHSPAARARTVELPEGTKGGSASEEELELKPEKSLPTQKVTLKMHQAEVAVVLRTLARAAGQNILINGEVTGETSTNIDNTPWDQAFCGLLRTHGLTYSWEGDILRVMTLKDMEHDLKINEIQEKQRAQKMGMKRVEPLLTRVVNIDFADANKLQKNLKEFLTEDKQGEPRGSVTVDEHTNALIIQAIRDDIVRMIPLIEKLDQPIPQILIEAHIVETTRETARDLGIQWGGLYQNMHNDKGTWITPGGTGGEVSIIKNPATGAYYLKTTATALGATGTSGKGFGVNFPADVSGGGASLGLMHGELWSGSILDMQLTALEEAGKLNILSSPSITTLDNQKAIIESGEEVPIQKAGALGTVEIEYKKAVLSLEVTPHVIETLGDTLKLTLVAKKDELDFNQEVQAEGYPVIRTKNTETTLILKDGQTAVIAGLSKELTAESERGVPWLKNIPGLGWLFRGESRSEQLQDLLIFITPHILKKEVEDQAPAQEQEQEPAPEQDQDQEPAPEQDQGQSNS
jgi:type IV pilus assembly protein PilQ